MTYRLSNLLILFTSILIILSAFSSTQVSNKPLMVTSETLSDTNEYLRILNNQYLSAGERGVIYDGIPIKAGRFEFLDVRKNESGFDAFTLNSQQQPILIRKQTKTMHISEGQALNFASEGLCLFKDAASNLQVFILGEDSLARQYLVIPESNALNLKLIRQFSVPPGAEYCAVNDEHAALFISEENIGVWHYNARPESELTRSLAVMTAPYGPLEQVGPLAVVSDQLIIAELGGSRVHQINWTNKHDHSSSHIWQLEKSTAIEQLQINVIGNEAKITLFDDNAGKTKLLSRIINLEVFQSSHNKIVEIPADAETQPVHNPGDAADDPALWIHPSKKDQSRILGTNKKRGLDVYNLSGERLQHLKVGRVNNVDVRQNFTLKGKATDIAAASQRDNDSIALFAINPISGEIRLSTEIKTTLEEVYGLCMYKGKKNKIYVFINNEHGQYEQYHIADSEDGWQGERVRSFAVQTQPEGCTADDKNHQLFFGEEAKGIWLIGAEPQDGNQAKLIIPVSDTLVADVEGMELYQNDEHNLLVVSSQGNDSYLIYQATAPYNLLGRFRIGINKEKGIDGASETDGLTVTSVGLNPEYPQGLLVVQDGRNFLPPETQNFKLLSWQKIIETIGIK